MKSCAHVAEMNTSAIYLCGAQEPGYARGMGLKTRATVEEIRCRNAAEINNNEDTAAIADCVGS